MEEECQDNNKQRLSKSSSPTKAHLAIIGSVFQKEIQIPYKV